MQLEKLFAAQKELRNHINYNGEDRFELLILALLVEIGECANEWRGFKFWSTDQEPNELKYDDHVDCWYDKKGKPHEEYKNPLLEEYVDGLHFILEIGIEIGVTDLQLVELSSFHYKATAADFTSIYKLASQLDYGMLLLGSEDYSRLFNNYLHLGTMLGFSWEQIEQAYFDKNQINHERQESGY